MTFSPKRLFLVDASGYIFRAYYAVRPLSTSKGLPTNALYGFTSMILKLLREKKPDLVGIVFDVARKTFRNDKFPAYKANRAEPPPDLVPQFPYFRKIVKALNLPVLELPDYEADDVIGTIAKQLKKKLSERGLAGSDLLRPAKRSERSHREQADEGFGGRAVSPPDQEEWETVIVTGDKDLMQLVDEKVSIYDPMKERTIRESEVIERFGVGPRQVADILGLAGDSSDNIPGVPGIGDKTATKLIQQHGSLEKVLEKADQVKGKMGEKLREFADQARLCKELATIVTDVPLQYDLKDFEVREPDRAALTELFGELEFKGFLKELGVESQGELVFKGPEKAASREVLIGNYLLDPDKRSLPIDDPVELGRQLEKEGLTKVFREIEMPLVGVLETMERNGVRVDTDRLKKSSEEYGRRLKEIEGEVRKKAGIDFNLNSPKQLSQVLFDQLKLPVIRKTKTGYSTDVEVLTELARLHEVPRSLLEYRSLSKLKSTYLDALPALVNPETGRVHTTFHQTVAATGRLSSSDPNLQNIPIRTEEGRKIREAFVTADGFRLLSADYSQIELRILAHMSGDKRLVEAFLKDHDVHTATAAGIFGVAESHVKPPQRSVGKTVNFAVLYGQGAYGLSQQLGIELGEAENYIRNYYARFERVASYKEEVLAEVRKSRIVRTLFGRLRRFPEIDSRNGNIRAMAERTAFNTIFQGTAADLIKMAMIAIQARIEREFPQAKMLIQVHDELVLEAPEGVTEKLARMAREEMEGAAELKVPLKVDVGTGSSWAEAH